MAVSLVQTAHPCTLQSLFFREGSEDAKYDQHASVELHAHEHLGDTLADVLEDCMVAPFVSTPIAITASKGLLWVLVRLGVAALTLPGMGVTDRGVPVPIFTPPSKSMALAPAWTCKPSITLQEKNEREGE